MNRKYAFASTAAGLAALIGSIGLGTAITQAAPPLQTPPGQQQQQNRPFLGVRLDDSTGKIIIASVVTGSPAEQAGLKKDDQIVKINGTAVATARQADAAVEALKVGDKVTIDIVRGSAASTVTATLASPPQRQAPPEHKVPAALQGLEGLTPDQRFDAQRGSTMSFVDKNGALVVVQNTPGKVASVDAANNKVTVTVNGGNATTYTVNADTIYRGATKVDDLKAGDRVEVQTVQSAPTVAISISKHDVNAQRGPGGFGGPRGGGPGGPGGQRGPQGAPQGGAQSGSPAAGAQQGRSVQ